MEQKRKRMNKGLEEKGRRNSELINTNIEKRWLTEKKARRCRERFPPKIISLRTRATTQLGWRKYVLGDTKADSRR